MEVQALQEKVLAQQKEIVELKRVQELLIERLEQVARLLDTMQDYHPMHVPLCKTWDWNKR
jgi:hypothetical protein